MSELEHYIHDYFSVTLDDCQKIVGLFSVQTYKKGDFFVKSGSYCNKLSFVQSGLFRFFIDLSNKETTQWIGDKGYFIQTSPVSYSEGPLVGIFRLSRMQKYLPLITISIPKLDLLFQNGTSSKSSLSENAFLH